MKIDLSIQKEKNYNKCITYHDAARSILDELGLDIKDEKLVFKLAVKIKRYGHHAKLSVYARQKLYFGKEGSSFFNETTNEKIETHKDLSAASDKDLIWNNPNYKTDANN